MNKSIVFFGSGPVAAKSLELLSRQFTIEAVVTKPRPPHHKGAVPVLDLVKQLSLPTIEANSRTDLTKKIQSTHFTSRVAVLVDFGIVVEQAVIDSFPLGIVNSHFSLLPEWRGADPITFSILSGQATTGVSLMLLVSKMDEGDLLAQTPYDIPSDITIDNLTNDLIDISDASLKAILPLYLDGQIVPAPQELATMSSSKSPTYSRKLSKQDGHINWAKTATVIEREVRAYLGWPKSYTRLGDIDVVITKATVVTTGNSDNNRPGTIRLDEAKNSLIIKCGQDYLSIETIKPAGKKDMSVKEFLAGYKARLIS